MSERVLIIGATSGIAESIARRYAARHGKLFLVARNGEKLQTLSSDLMVRGASEVETFVMDANDTAQIPLMVDGTWQALGAVDIALIAHGTLSDQRRAETDIAYAIAEFRTNAESVIACLIGLATRFEAQGRGVIAVIGSVSGDRGRASNYLYGSAKAAIETYVSGLRASLFKRGVHILIIKPGFVSTRMTAGLDLPERLTAEPSRVARDIDHAIAKRKDIVYTPWFWSWIMQIIRFMPTAIFKRIQM